MVPQNRIDRDSCSACSSKKSVNGTPRSVIETERNKISKVHDRVGAISDDRPKDHLACFIVIVCPNAERLEKERALCIAHEVNQGIAQNDGNPLLRRGRRRDSLGQSRGGTKEVDQKDCQAGKPHQRVHCIGEMFAESREPFNVESRKNLVNTGGKSTVLFIPTRTLSPPRKTTFDRIALRNRLHFLHFRIFNILCSEYLETVRKKECSFSSDN